MKSTISVLSALVIFAGAHCTLLADADPLQNFSVTAVAGARKLHAALADTTWVYHFNGKDYPLRFGKSGEIETLKEWSDVNWRVASPSEVILDRPGGDLMLLRFNDSVTSFQCKDWTGPNATGTKAAKIRG